MDDREMLQQILQGQGSLQEGMRSMTLTINEIREESRSMRQSMTEASMTMVDVKADIRHIREDASRLEVSNAREHDSIDERIKTEVQVACDEKRRCKAEREVDARKLSEDIRTEVSLKIERLKTRTTVGILVYALSIIAFFIKETFFK